MINYDKLRGIICTLVNKNNLYSFSFANFSMENTHNIKNNK